MNTTKTLNTHGLKIDMDSLQKAAEWTQSLPTGGVPQLVIEVAYDPEDGIIEHEVHFDQNSWVNWLPGVYRIGFYSYRSSAQGLVDDIAETLKELERVGELT